MDSIRRGVLAVTALIAAVLCNGCSIRKLAVNQLGSALAAQGTTFASDDDPELVGDALPFALKLMESLLAESPNHTPLLVATSRGFTQYAYGWVGSDAEGETDSAEAARARTKRLALRARDYGLRALSVSIDNFRVRFASDPAAALRLAEKRDVPALYWTAAAWGLAISNGKDDVDLLGDLSLVETLIARAAELDPAFDHGAIDTFRITLEASRMAVSKDAAVRAREHFRRAVEQSDGQLAAPFVAAAEALTIPEQNREQFDDLLARALAIDPNRRPEWRLHNLVAQRRAAWLVAHRDDYFVDDAEGGAQ